MIRTSYLKKVVLKNSYCQRFRGFSYRTVIFSQLYKKFQLGVQESVSILLIGQDGFELHISSHFNLQRLVKYKVQLRVPDQDSAKRILAIC